MLTCIHGWSSAPAHTLKPNAQAQAVRPSGELERGAEAEAPANPERTMGAALAWSALVRFWFYNWFSAIPATFIKCGSLGSCMVEKPNYNNDMHGSITEAERGVS